VALALVYLSLEVRTLYQRLLFPRRAPPAPSPA
jgi:hypothetical protein